MACAHMSTETAIALVKSAQPETGAGAGCVGITSVIASHFRGGTKFAAPIPPNKDKGPKSKDKASGLDVGRYTDHLLRRVVEKGVRLDPSNYKHQRCIHFLAALKSVGIRIVRVQFQVAIPHLKIKTALDALGVDAFGRVVVIELKCTTFSKSRYASRYKEPCRNRGRMLHIDNMNNTEHAAHSIQTGFGMLALRRCVPDGTPIRGVIVTCSTDGASIYMVDPKFAVESLFILGGHSTVRRVDTKLASFTRLPENPATRALILERAASMGFAHLDAKIRLGSFVVTSFIGRKKRYMIVALVHTANPGDAIGTRKKDQLHADAKSLWLRKKRKMTVMGCFFCYSANESSFVQRVEFLDHQYPACTPESKPQGRQKKMKGRKQSVR